MLCKIFTDELDVESNAFIKYTGDAKVEGIWNTITQKNIRQKVGQGSTFRD